MLRRYLFAIFIFILSAGISGCSTTGQENRAVHGTDTGQSKNGEPEMSPEMSASPSPKADAPLAANEKYGISLPQPEQFATELKNLIYWNHASKIYKDDAADIYSDMKRAGLLGQNVTAQVFYKEEYCEDYDYLESNFYSVAVRVPALDKYSGGCSLFELRYNTKGMASEIDTDFEWEEEQDEDATQKKSQYAEYGTITLNLTEKEAENTPELHLTEEEKQEKQAIIEKIKKEIQKTGDLSENDIYIHDFTLADTHYSGCIIFRDTGNKDYMPYGWVHGLILYPGKKMQKEPIVDFSYRYTTAFNGGGYSKDAAIRLAKEQEESIITDNCLLVYRAEDKKWIEKKEFL